MIYDYTAYEYCLGICGMVMIILILILARYLDE